MSLLVMSNILSVISIAIISKVVVSKIITGIVVVFYQNITNESLDTTISPTYLTLETDPSQLAI
jgi:hypothetical protein